MKNIIFLILINVSIALASCVSKTPLNKDELEILNSLLDRYFSVYYDYPPSKRVSSHFVKEMFGNKNNFMTIPSRFLINLRTEMRLYGYLMIVDSQIKNLPFYLTRTL